MKFFSSKNKGAISVFMTIIYLWVFILEAILVDGGRMRLAEAEAEEAQQMANESVMALYNESLYQYYDLFGQTKYKDKSELEKLVKDFMTTQLGGYSKTSVFGKRNNIAVPANLKGNDYFDPFHFEIEINDIDRGAFLNLGNQEVFKSQINDSMKYKGPVYLAQNFFDVLGKMGSLNDVNNAVKKSTETVTPIYDEYGEYVKEAKKVQKDVDDFLVDPLGNGQDIDKFTDDINEQLEDNLIDFLNDMYKIKHADDEDEEDEKEIEYDDDGNPIEDSEEDTGSVIVEEYYGHATKKVQSYIDTIKKINEQIGSEDSDGLLHELKSLEDTANDLIDKSIDPGKKTLTDNTSGDYKEYSDDKNTYNDHDKNKDINDTYKGFADNLDILKDKNVKPSIEANKKYREGLNEIKNSTPSFDDIEDYMNSKFLAGYLHLLEDVNRDFDSYEYLFDDEDEEDEEDEDEDKKVVKSVSGLIDPKFKGSKVDSYNIFVKNKIETIKKEDTITKSLLYDEDFEKELGKDFNPKDKNKSKEVLKKGLDKTSHSSDAEDMSSLEGEEITEFSPANGHHFGTIEQITRSKESPKNYDKISETKKPKESVGERNSAIAGLSEQIGKVLAGGRDSLFECAYIMSYFRDYVHVGHMKKENISDKKYDTVLNTKFIDGVDQSKVFYLTAEEFKKIEVTCAEAEYVLYGNTNTEADVTAAYAEIFALRLLLDYISVWLTPELREAVLETAASMGPAAPLVIAAMPLAFSVPRALADMMTIMTAKRCPLIFRAAEDWVINTWDESDLMVGYGDYLLMFLLIDLGDTKTKRMQDVIQTNMKKLDKDFNLNEAYVNLYVQSECSINWLFMSEAFIPTKWRLDNRHKFKVNTNFSY